MPDLRINHDRRVADVQTVYDPVNGDFNSLFATRTPLLKTIYDGSRHPPLKTRKGDLFLVKNIFTDFKTRSWRRGIRMVCRIPESLIPFPPDDTASSLDPGNRSTPGLPQFGHNRIKLTVLFDAPLDAEQAGWARPTTANQTCYRVRALRLK
jgi:hypothetical protein